MPLPIAKSRLDGDAAAYIARSGAQDRAAINAFVRGVKALGLWESMVCWPLRSAQNSGGADPTNTTVYSLGGLGTFNGTRVNGPAWTADGVVFQNSDNTHITINVSQALPATWMTAVNFESQVFRNIFNHDDGVSFVPSVGLAPESLGNTWYFQLVNSAGGVINATRSASLGVMRWASFSVQANPDTSLARVDGSTATSTLTGTIPTLTRLFLGRRSDGLYANMTLPFFGLVSGYHDTDALRALYKSTLGTGLGLP